MKFLFFLLVATVIAVTLFRLLLPPLQEEEEDFELPAEDEQFDNLLQDLLGPAGSAQQRAYDRFLAMGPLVLARLTQVLSQELFLAQNPHYIERLKALILDFGLRSVPVLLDLLEEDGDDPAIVEACQELLRSFGSSAFPVMLNRCELIHVPVLFPLLLEHRQVALHALMQRLEKRPQDPRFAAFLHRFGSEAEQALLEAVRTWTGGARRQAFLLLSQLASEQAIPLFCEALGDTFPEVRVAAVSALGRLKATHSLSLLQPLLQDRDARVRQATLHTFLKWRDPRSLPAVQRFLQKSESLSNHERLLSQVLMIHLGEENDLTSLRHVLKDAYLLPPEILLEVLSCFPAEEQQSPLFERLVDSHSSARSNMLAMVLDWPAQESAPFLLRLLDEMDFDDSFADKVEESLKDLDTSALPVFLSVLQEESSSHRRLVLQLILSKPHPSAVVPVLDYLESSDLSEVYWELDLPLLRHFLLHSISSHEEMQALKDFVQRHPETMLTSELAELLPELHGSIVPKSALT